MACGGGLKVRSSSLICLLCHREYEVRDDIPIFLEEEGDYRGEIPLDEMAELLAVGREKGWREALFNRLMVVHPFLYRYACDWRRGDFRFLLPQSREGIALDMGAGLGMITRCLSGSYREVVAIDPVFERASFLEIIRKQEGLSNVTVICGGGSLAYPFPEEAFDVIVVSGVLEWVGDFYRKLPPYQAQEIMLRKVWSYLKTGGTLYLAIENRYGYQYLLGMRDHNGMRFTSLIPRAIANTVSKWRKGDIYRTLTHSLRGYVRLLSASGFNDVRLHWAFPDYREMQAVVPLNKSGCMSFFVNNFMPSDTPGQKLQRSLAIWFDRLGLLPFAVTTFGIIASKASSELSVSPDRQYARTRLIGRRGLRSSRNRASGKGEESLIRGIVEDFGARYKTVGDVLKRKGASAGGEEISFVQIVRNPAAHGKSIFIVFYNDDPFLLVKVSRRDSAKRFMRNEADVVKRLISVFPERWAGSIPVVLARGDYGGWLVLVEEFVKGRLLSRDSSDRRLAVGLRWLEIFYRTTARRVTVKGAVLERNFLGPLREYERCFGESSAVDRAVDSLISEFKGRDLSLTARHGDFWSGNIINRKPPLVVDWDFGSFDELPFFDYFYYLGHDLWLERGGSFGDAFRVVLDHHADRTASDIKTKFTHLGYLPKDLPLLYTMFALEACLCQRQRLLEDEEHGFLSFSPELERKNEDYRKKLSGEYFHRLAQERLAWI